MSWIYRIFILFTTVLLISQITAAQTDVGTGVATPQSDDGRSEEGVPNLATRQAAEASTHLSGPIPDAQDPPETQEATGLRSPVLLALAVAAIAVPVWRLQKQRKQHVEKN